MTQDLSSFRFPTRPVSILPEEDARSDEDEGNEEEGEGEGTLNLTPPWQDPIVAARSTPGQWLYDSRAKLLVHQGQRKKIALKNLDSTDKIVRLITAVEIKPEMDVQGLMHTLNQACADCYDASLLTVLSAHAGGSVLQWGEDRAAMVEEVDSNGPVTRRRSF